MILRTACYGKLHRLHTLLQMKRTHISFGHIATQEELENQHSVVQRKWLITDLLLYHEVAAHSMQSKLQNVCGLCIWALHVYETMRALRSAKRLSEPFVGRQMVLTFVWFGWNDTVCQCMSCISSKTWRYTGFAWQAFWSMIVSYWLPAWSRTIICSSGCFFSTRSPTRSTWWHETRLL